MLFCITLNASMIENVPPMTKINKALHLLHAKQKGHQMFHYVYVFKSNVRREQEFRELEESRKKEKKRKEKKEKKKPKHKKRKQKIRTRQKRKHIRGCADCAT